jgi:hypothetical protein
MDLPEKVYKYRIWNNSFHKNILLYNELYLESPMEINDPFDCRIPPNYKNQTHEEKNKYITDLAISRFDEVQHQGLDMRQVLTDFEKRMNDPEKFQREAEKYIFEQQDRHYGILSLSKRWNGILLWSHYSDSHKGFCVGFWTKKLWETGFFGKAGLVNYDVKFPEIKPTVGKDKVSVTKEAFIQTHTKSKEWKYEKEFRFLNVFFPHEPKPFERIIQVPDSVFSDVTIGINTSDTDKEEIIAVCKRKHIPVYQAIKKDFMFEIDRELLK